LLYDMYAKQHHEEIQKKDKPFANP
jgi:hypothetical protein